MLATSDMGVPQSRSPWMRMYLVFPFLRSVSHWSSNVFMGVYGVSGSLKFLHCLRNLAGFSKMTFWTVLMQCWRLRISRAHLITASGSEIPQSHAEFIQMFSMPNVSRMSMALAAVHFDSG